GRLEGFSETQALFADDLPTVAAEADLYMRTWLDDIDEYIERTHPSWPHQPDAPRSLELASGSRSVDLERGGISTVIWATGFRREYPWLHVPALDARGEIVHHHGATQVPGLYVLGLRFQRRRASHIIGGVGLDALHIAQRIADTAAERERHPLGWLGMRPRAVPARRRNPVLLGANRNP